MIIQALTEYYERKQNDSHSALAPYGFELKEIPFIIELNQAGELVQIEDTREAQGKKKIGRLALVPQTVKRSSGIAANLLWDNAEYVLGVDTRDKPERVAQQHKDFLQRLLALPELIRQSTGVSQAITFLENLQLPSLESSPAWEDILSGNPNMSFRLQGNIDLICQHPDIQSFVQLPDDDENENTATRLVSGSKQPIERLHPAIKGVWGAQSSGGNIVSFNLDAFNSYGKDQSYNAPIGKQATFAYSTALNHLLRKGSSQRLQVGDSSTVFWAEKPHEFETQIVDIFGDPTKDDPDKNTRAVEALYKSINMGLLDDNEAATRFYVLGLAPNAARIAIRFWEVATVRELATRIRQHFDDLAIVHSEKQLPHLPLFRLLVATATQGKADNIPPNLAGETMRSILAGTPYPQSLLAAAVRRNRAEHEVTYPRASLIKACLNRAIRRNNTHIMEELTVSLDENNTNIGYRLGRLFAVLEKTQEEASPGINATIRDRFYAAASSTPVSVFSTLLKLKNHHISKIENKGRATNLEKLYGEIFSGIDHFPANLSLTDQGNFAIGYYHQRQNFFKKRETADNTGKGAE